DHGIQFETLAGEDPRQGFGLRHGARKAVEDEATGRIRLDDTVGHDLVDDLVRDEAAGIHDRLGPLADLGSSLDRRAQHVTRRQLGNAVPLDQPLRLRSLARSGRSEQNQPHLFFLPPRSFDFLISPSYWCATRCPWICATVSSVTLTTIKSEVPPR